jgi:hypothetical protein
MQVRRIVKDQGKLAWSAPDMREHSRKCADQNVKSRRVSGTGEPAG